MRFWSTKSVLRSGTAAIALLASTAAHAQVKIFDVPSEDAVKAIPEFARQAGIEILVPANQLKGIRTPAIKGSIELHAALNQLLGGTGVTVVSDDGQTIALSAPPKNAEAASNEGAATIPGLETVLVTGTRLPDVQPASPVTTVTREDILNSGYFTTGDVIRSLPQNFSGGINPGVVSAPGVDNQSNRSGASSFDLRGIGASSTLTLVDGHRLAADGFAGSTDVSMIPVSAIDRIEVVTDGASAIYGSDAVAGVANFILRKDFDGAESSARYGAATQGGDEDYGFDQTLGKAWTGGNALVSYEYDRSNGLDASQRPFSDQAESPYNLLPRQNRNSVFATINQDVSTDTSLYLEGLYTSRYSASASTEFNNTYFNTAQVQQYGVSAGGQQRLWGDWVAYLDGTYSDDRDVFHGGSPFHYDNGLQSIETHAAGTLFDLPSGPIKFAIGGGYRRESYADPDDGKVSRNVGYAYAEAAIPLVTPSPSRVGLERLDLSVAGRIENYSDFGLTTNPKIGVVYEPVSDVRVRGTWGTSFHAPSFVQAFALSEVDLYPASFWGVTTPNSVVMLTGGANPDLQPEKSTAWTIGTDYEPSEVPGLKLGFTYYDIAYRGRIGYPFGADLLEALDGNPAYASFVINSPSAGLQQKLISGAGLYNNFSGQPYDPSKVIAIVDDAYHNLSQQDISGVDLNANYGWENDWGSFTLGGSASWITIKQKVLQSSPSEKLSGTVFNPPDWKARLNAAWSMGDWSVSAAINYVDGELNNSIGTSNIDGGPLGPPIPVSSLTTMDLQVAYHLPMEQGFFGGMRISVAVQNLFDQDPPLIDATSTLNPGFRFDSTNASPIGRFVSVNLTKDF